MKNKRIDGNKWNVFKNTGRTDCIFEHLHDSLPGPNS